MTFVRQRAFCSVVAAMAAVTAGAADRPNILYIMCDDMGYGDLGCYGQKLIATPNIDSLAAQGIRFTQAYAGSPVSAPSRACFMTGQHSGHTLVRGNKEYWRDKLQENLYGDNADYTVVGQHPYDPEHVIIPEIFKREGYATGMFGKWAGGYEGSESTPDKRGVEEYFGYLCQFQAHLYYPNFLNEFSTAKGDSAVHRVTLEGNVPYPMYGPEYLNRPQYSADIIHERALEWLDAQTDEKPFLGIFTYTLPHAELIQPDDEIYRTYVDAFPEDEERKYGGDQGSRYNPTDHGHAQFAGMITRLDRQVGEIMAKLEEKGLADNTVLIFTSDNGPHEEGGADPNFFNRDGLLKGIKRSTHEGGIRIPFIVRWPARIQPGQESEQQFAFYDLMATFCDIAGITDYEEKYGNGSATDYFDGISIYPTLTGEGEQAQHDALYWEFHETNMLGVRRDDWKLVVKNGTCHLYDLATDLHEDHDLAAEHPDVVEELKAVIYREHTPSEYFNVTLPL